MHRSSSWKPYRRWLAMGVALVALVSCGNVGRGQFERSAEAMEKVARTAGPSDGRGERPQEIGELLFDDVHRDGDLVYFKVGDHFTVDPYGYVWSPERRPVDDDSDDAVASSFEHIQGHWYWWSDSY